MKRDWDGSVWDVREGVGGGGVSGRRVEGEWRGKVWSLWEDPYFWIRSFYLGRRWVDYRTWLELAESSQGRWVLVQEAVWSIGEKRFLWWYLLRTLFGSVFSFGYQFLVSCVNLVRFSQFSHRVFVRFFAELFNVIRGSSVLRKSFRVLVTLFNRLFGEGLKRVSFRLGVEVINRVGTEGRFVARVLKRSSLFTRVFNWWWHHTNWLAYAGMTNGRWYRIQKWNWWKGTVKWKERRRWYRIDF